MSNDNISNKLDALLEETVKQRRLMEDILELLQIIVRTNRMMNEGGISQEELMDALGITQEDLDAADDVEIEWLIEVICT